MLLEWTAQLEIIQNDPSTLSVQSIPRPIVSWMKQKRILLSSSHFKVKEISLDKAMSSLSLQKQYRVGESVIVTEPESSTPIAAGYAYPSSEVDAHSVQFSANAYLSLVGKQVSISSLSDSPFPVLVAESIQCKLKGKHQKIDQAFWLHLERALEDVALIVEKENIEIWFGGRPWLVELCEIMPKIESNCAIYRIGPKTRLVEQHSTALTPMTDVSLASIHSVALSLSMGGLSTQLKQLLTWFDTRPETRERLERLKIHPVRGVLLFGPPGTGKSLILRHLPTLLGVTSHIIQGAELVGRFVGESERKLRQVFQRAKETAPCLIVMDEVDALCPSREAVTTTAVEKRLVATFLALLDDLQNDKNLVMILAATNRRDALDSALRRSGRLDHELEIPVPNAEARLEILKCHFQRVKHELTMEQIKEKAQKSHGFVGADLEALVRESIVAAVKRKQRSNSLDSVVTYDDVNEASRLVRPSAMRDSTVEVPNVQWSDIGGLENVQQQLMESVEWPLQHPEAFLRLGIRPPRGVLLYGPPGCAKTLIAKALATTAGLPFLAVQGPSLYTRYVGDSEKAVRDIFRKARAVSPSILFFDEIDALAMRRGAEAGSAGSVSDRVLSQLLQEMDGMSTTLGVTVMAATNRPDVLDSALMRPGRFDRAIYVAPPNRAARRKILDIRLKDVPLSDDVDLEILADKTDGYSGAETVAVCNEAALFAMEDDPLPESCKLYWRHFQDALSRVQPRITPQVLQFYQDFEKSRRGQKSLT